MLFVLAEFSYDEFFNAEGNKWASSTTPKDKGAKLIAPGNFRARQPEGDLQEVDIMFLLAQLIWTLNGHKLLIEREIVK